MPVSLSPKNNNKKFRMSSTTILLRIFGLQHLLKLFDGKIMQKLLAFFQMSVHLKDLIL